MALNCLWAGEGEGVLHTELNWCISAAVTPGRNGRGCRILQTLALG